MWTETAALMFLFTQPASVLSQQLSSCEPLHPQVGEGSSFRRQERERYAAPGLRNMANLAHATEEELLAAAEVQVRS